MAPQTISSIIRSHACEFLDDRLVGLGESHAGSSAAGTQRYPLPSAGSAVGSSVQQSKKNSSTSP